MTQISRKDHHRLAADSTITEQNFTAYLLHMAQVEGRNLINSETGTKFTANLKLRYYYIEYILSEISAKQTKNILSHAKS